MFPSNQLFTPVSRKTDILCRVTGFLHSPVRRLLPDAQRNQERRLFCRVIIAELKCSVLTKGMATPGNPGFGRLVVVAILVFLVALRGQNLRPTGPINLTLDATEINRQLLHAELAVPVNPGPLTLAYPKWIPGNHAPTGPIESLVGLKLFANGQPLAWRRDRVQHG